jgi:hypothetical protein
MQILINDECENKDQNVNENMIWNFKSLDQPPVVAFDYSPNEYNLLLKNSNFEPLFNQNLQKLTNLLAKSKSLFQNEKFYLEKIIFKNWNALRKEKSLQLMRKLKGILNSFEQLKLDILLANVGEILNRNNRNIKFLPSKEYFEFLLVRLLSAYKLLDYGQVLIKAKILFYIVKNIKHAIFLSNNILFLSIISRIYCLFKCYQQQTAFLYNILKENICLFKATTIKWSENFLVDRLPISLTSQKYKKNVSEESKKLTKPEIQFENEVNKMEQDIGEVILRDDSPMDKKLDKVDYSKSFFKKFKLFLKEKNFNLKVFKLNFSKYIKRQVKRNNSLDFVSFLKSVCTDNKEYSEKLNSLIKASNLEGKKKIITKKFFLILNKNLKI